MGLDNSGKSTLINHLKPAHAASLDVVPTVGFSQEQFTRGSIKFTVFDMSGAGTYRSLWESFYADVNAVIFVADASDSIRMCVAKDELDALLKHPDMQKPAPGGGGGGNRCPILVFANKSDLPGALEPAEVSVMLGLTALHDRAWHIAGSNALTGEGVEDGITWLSTNVT